MKKAALIFCAFVAGAVIGAACLWTWLRPATRAMATWVGLGFPEVPVEVALGTDTGVAEHPLLQLLETPAGIEWKLVMMGKEVAASREHILPILGELARYDSTLTVFIHADPNVDVATLKACIADISNQGLSHFWIQDTLRGTSHVEISGRPNRNEMSAEQKDMP